MVLKKKIKVVLPINYQDFIREILEKNENFKYLYKIVHIINPILKFTDKNILKKRELIFHYPIPKFLSLIIGNSFEIKIIETTVFNKNRCSVHCHIIIDTLIGEIKFLETAIYNIKNDKISIRIELSSITNNLSIILTNIANMWEKDRKEYLKKILEKYS